MKKIEICIGTDRAKHVRARLSLLSADGSEHYHSINIAPGDDLAAIRAANEADICSPTSKVPGAPWPKIPDEAWADVEAHCAIIHKAAVVAAHRASVEKERAEQQARKDASEKARQEAEAERAAEFKRQVAEAVEALRSV